MTLIGLILPALLLASQPSRPDCADVAGCRQAALDAAAQQDFERFHDLAWRAIQRGRPNDPELMQLVARAQSLSGRPGDALVMLRRLAEMGVVTDARESDDFRGVRMLPGWPQVEAALARAADHAAPGSTASSSLSPPASSKPAAPADKAGSVTNPVRFTPVPAASTGGELALRLPEATIEPIGLAYDGTSRRFVVADRHANKLVVADEVFKQVNDLIGAASGGFGALGALEIDPRRGDLWVTSSAASGVATIHKLQLVSGRVLSRIDVAGEPATLTDMVVSDSGALWLVDSRGGRLFRIRPSDGHVERTLALSVNSPTSLTVVNDTAYVAHVRGVALVDLVSGGVTEVRAAKNLSLAGLRRVRWNRGALIAIQAAGDVERLVRIRLARNGRAATAIDVLDGNVDTDGTALTISRDAAYYVAHGTEGPIIRRVALK